MSGLATELVWLGIAVIAGTLFGRTMVFPLLAPLGPSQLALAMWLLAKGFPGPDQD